MRTGVGARGALWGGLAVGGEGEWSEKAGGEEAEGPCACRTRRVVVGEGRHWCVVWCAVCAARGSVRRGFACFRCVAASVGHCLCLCCWCWCCMCVGSSRRLGSYVLRARVRVECVSACQGAYLPPYLPTYLPTYVTRVVPPWFCFLRDCMLSCLCLPPEARGENRRVVRACLFSLCGPLGSPEPSAEKSASPHDLIRC
jgi:hypothetical protein